MLLRAGISGLTVLGHVFSPEGLIVPFLLVPVIGAAAGFAALSVAQNFVGASSLAPSSFVTFASLGYPQLHGPLAKIGPSLGGGAVVEFGFCGFVFGDFFLFR